MAFPSTLSGNNCNPVKLSALSVMHKLKSNGAKTQPWCTSLGVFTVLDIWPEISRYLRKYKCSGFEFFLAA